MPSRKYTYKHEVTGETVAGEIMSAATLLAVVTNAINVTQYWHKLSATGTAAQRSLRTVSGGYTGSMLLLEKDAASPGDVVIDDNAGNIKSAGNFTLTDPSDKIAFIFDGNFWCELFRSNNG